MKIYKVFHNKNFLEVPSFKWGIEVVPDPKKLELVATVNCRGLEDVFRCTNHIDKLWWENPNVLSFVKSRSTSCGDVIEDPSGDRHVVTVVGFMKLN